MIREGFSEEATFEQISQGGKRVNPMNIWEKSIPGIRNSMCKGPVACSKKGREARVAGWSGRKIGEEVSKMVRDQVAEGLMEHG